MHFSMCGVVTCNSPGIGCDAVLWGDKQRGVHTGSGLYLTAVRAFYLGLDPASPALALPSDRGTSSGLSLNTVILVLELRDPSRTPSLTGLVSSYCYVGSWGQELHPDESESLQKKRRRLSQLVYTQAHGRFSEPLRDRRS